MNSYTLKDCLELKTIADFIRFGYLWSNQAELFYGHGTDNSWDDVKSLILGSLSLPFNSDVMILNARLLDKKKNGFFPN